MAAPPVTARVLPTHNIIENGFPTTIALSLNSAINFREKTVMPPGVDGGEMIDITENDGPSLSANSLPDYGCGSLFSVSLH